MHCVVNFIVSLSASIELYCGYLLYIILFNFNFVLFFVFKPVHFNLLMMPVYFQPSAVQVVAYKQVNGI